MTNNLNLSLVCRSSALVVNIINNSKPKIKQSIALIFIKYKFHQKEKENHCETNQCLPY